MVCVALSACATTGTSIPPEITRADHPVINTTSTVRLGESMVKKSKTYAYDAIQLNEEFKAGDGAFMLQITIPPQKLKAKSELKNNILYMASDATVKDLLLGTKPAIAGICVPKDDEKTKWRIYYNGVCTSLGTKNLPSHSFTKDYDTTRPSLTRELIYNGRVDNDVKIIYRELSNDMMRPAFQQDLQYDMATSKEIAFKEVTLNVVSADNREITYVVTSHFIDVE